MTNLVRLWLEIAHNVPFQVGGWAFVRANGDQVSGYAGGERRCDADQTALVGLLAALKDVSGPVRIATSSAVVAGVPARITAAQAGDDPPTANLALWAQAMTALAAGSVEIVRVAAPSARPGDPGAFAKGWADLSLDRAKGKTSFSWAIPRPNLAKVVL